MKDPAIHFGEWRGFRLGARQRYSAMTSTLASGFSSCSGQGARGIGIFAGDVQRATRDWLANDRRRDELSVNTQLGLVVDPCSCERAERTR